MYTKKVSILTCLLLLTGLCAIGLFSLLYRFDNKYIMRASLSQEGFSVIKGDSSDPRKIIRNKGIANIFSQMGLVEAWGSGIKRILNAAEE